MPIRLHSTVCSRQNVRKQSEIMPKSAPAPLGYPVPSNEEERLQELLSYEFQDRGAEASLDQVCLLAQSLFSVPVALLTLVGRDEQTFLAKCGVDADGSPRKDAFCTYTIMNDEVFVVTDATQDERFMENPLVTGAMHIRFYAGAPLTVRPGIRIGSLCLIDTKPRQFSEADATRLQMLATIAVNELHRRRTMIDLRRQQDLLSQTARMANIGSWSLDRKTNTVVWSKETYRIFEVDPDITPTFAMMEGFWGEECAHKVAMEFLVRDRAPFDLELQTVTAKGSQRWVRCIAEAEAAEGAVARIGGSIQDITEQRERAGEIERLAFSDTLTGLPNRALFQKLFAAALAAAEQNDSNVGLLMLDLDHFKDVNDTLGHDAGDALLRTVSERLLSVYRDIGTVTRIGGDEFAIILPDIRDPDDLRESTERILELLRHPHKHGGLSISASVGSALYPQDDRTTKQLLKNADIALYKAKGVGRNRYVAFEAGMRIEVEDRLALLGEIKSGIAKTEFVLYYQPLVSVAPPQAVIGFEALMRWTHPDRGVLTPDKFLAGFEDQELSLALGEVALESAMAQMRTWLDQGIQFRQVAVNLSASQFRTGHLAQTVIDKLARWGIPPACLALEVTENVYMGWDSDEVGETIRTLHGAGIQIALDDFGTGYASLTNLKNFPIDQLKIDKSFIQDLNDPAIVAAILMLGATMGMAVVAEGVEDKIQLDLLRMMGCDQAQGYYFAKPMPAAQVAAFLKAFAKTTVTSLDAVA